MARVSRFGAWLPQGRSARVHLSLPPRGAARGNGKVQKIPTEREGCLRTLVVAPEQRAEFFPRPEHFPAPRSPPAVVGGRQIEQLEAAVHCGVTPVVMARLVRLDRTIHLAPDIRELLDQGQRLPAASSEAGVATGRDGHLTSPARSRFVGSCPAIRRHRLRACDCPATVAR